MCSVGLQRFSTGKETKKLNINIPPSHTTSLETVQKEAEQGSLEQENLNEKFSEELANIAAALNNSFSHWKELQV